MKRAVLSMLLIPAVIGCAGDPSIGVGEEAVKSETNHHFPDQASFFAGGGGGGSNLSYHNGPVIHSAHVVPIFWGPSWATGGSDNGNATTIQAYVGNFGTTSHYNVITQYYDTTGSISLSNLGSTSYFDSTSPPQNVTDADIQAEVTKVIGALGSFDASAIYEVFLPSTSYSSDGSSTSCGGPNLKYCAYHGHYAGANGDTKYASMPYPSCGGCQTSGFSTVQNFEHFISHETREAVTDEDGNAWYDRRGYEADDKCAWSPTPFTDSSGYAYQYEWSNAAGGCVQ